MEKTYRNVGFLFIAILAVVFFGFFRTYFGLFPRFENITTAQHFHGIVFILWFALLIVQPFLIKAGKEKLHRLIGKSSYVLAPLVVLSILGVAREQYYRDLAQLPADQAIGHLVLPLPQMAVFATLYILAMVNRKKTSYHMRYIIASSLVLIGPGLGRIFIIWMGMPFPVGVLYAFAVTDLVLLALIMYDLVKKGTHRPYVIALILLLISHLAWYFLPASAFWQTICGWFVKAFF